MYVEQVMWNKYWDQESGGALLELALTLGILVASISGFFALDLDALLGDGVEQRSLALRTLHSTGLAPETSTGTQVLSVNNGGQIRFHDAGYIQSSLDSLLLKFHANAPASENTLCIAAALFQLDGSDPVGNPVFDIESEVTAATTVDCQNNWNNAFKAHCGEEAKQFLLSSGGASSKHFLCSWTFAGDIESVKISPVSFKNAIVIPPTVDDKSTGGVVAVDEATSLGGLEDIASSSSDEGEKGGSPSSGGSMETGSLSGEGFESIS